MNGFSEGGAVPRAGGWLTLIRISTVPISGIPASNEIVKVAVHWVGGRSTPCPGAECPACDTYGSRLYGFLGFNPSGDRSLSKAVLELPGRLVERVEDALDFRREVNATGVWQFSRKTRKGNVAFTEDMEKTPPKLREIAEWEIYQCLAAIWSMPEAPNRTTDLKEWVERMRAAAIRQLEGRMACVLAGDPGGGA